MEPIDEFIDSLSSDSFIAIRPDGGEEEIMVSKAILCQTSRYFVKALQREDLEEAHDKTLRFPGWSSEVVELFVFWAYKQTLPGFVEPLTIEDIDDGFECNREVQLTLSRLWLFANAYDIPRLQNAVMKKLLALSEVIRLIYEETSEYSELRNFARDEARYEFWSSDKGYGLTEEDLSTLLEIPGFAVDFMEGVKGILESGRSIGKKTYASASDVDGRDYFVDED